MVKDLPANAGDMSSIPGLGRPPGVGNGFPPQYSCLENSKDSRAWWAIVQGVAKKKKASILRRSAFFTVQLSHPFMITGKTIVVNTIGDATLSYASLALETSHCL